MRHDYDRKRLRDHARFFVRPPHARLLPVRRLFSGLAFFFSATFPSSLFVMLICCTACVSVLYVCSYTCEEGELGECMIIPARYIGEAEAPIFYFFDDGIRFKKE
jgi:hypothetical protein